MNPPIALVTGANSGIGLELTKKLLTEGWEVVALVRSSFPNGEPIIEQSVANNRLRIYQTDLSHFSQLNRSLALIRDREASLDLIFNNAGISFGSLRPSKQGRDVHFDVNTVAPYLILMELKELLKRGTLKTVINTSSNVLLMVKRFSPDELLHPKQENFKKVVGIYGQSKLGLSLWTKAIASELAGEGIMIRSVCPGGNKTALTSGDAMPGWLMIVRNLFFSHPKVGAERLYTAALDKRLNRLSGVFINKGKSTAIPFERYAEEMLSIVSSIYQTEFVPIKSVE